MPDEKRFIDHDGQKICVEFSAGHSERDRFVVCVHGGPGGTKEGPSDLFLNFKETLEQIGYTVVRFDMIGAGDSEGNYRFMTVADQSKQLRAIIDFAKSMKMGAMSLIAESMGATIALFNWPPEAKKAALLWPAVDLMGTDLTEYLNEEHQANLKKNGYTLEGDIEIGAEFVSEFQSLGSLQTKFNSIECPLIFIHGDNDSSVPHTQTEEAFEEYAHEKKMIIVPGGEHCLRDEQPEVISHLRDWFQ